MSIRKLGPAGLVRPQIESLQSTAEAQNLGERLWELGLSVKPDGGLAGLAAVIDEAVAQLTPDVAQALVGAFLPAASPGEVSRYNNALSAIDSGVVKMTRQSDGSTLVLVGNGGRHNDHRLLNGIVAKLGANANFQVRSEPGSEVARYPLDDSDLAPKNGLDDQTIGRLDDALQRAFWSIKKIEDKTGQLMISVGGHFSASNANTASDVILRTLGEQRPVRFVRSDENDPPLFQCENGYLSKVLPDGSHLLSLSSTQCLELNRILVERFPEAKPSVVSSGDVFDEVIVEMAPQTSPSEAEQASTAVAEMLPARAYVSVWLREGEIATVGARDTDFQMNWNAAQAAVLEAGAMFRGIKRAARLGGAGPDVRSAKTDEERYAAYEKQHADTQVTGLVWTTGLVVKVDGRFDPQDIEHSAKFIRDTLSKPNLSIRFDRFFDTEELGDASIARSQPRYQSKGLSYHGARRDQSETSR